VVIIEKDRCIGCGSCVEICHEGCMMLEGGRVVIDHALCSTCTQCVAICPQKALSWDGVQPVPFESDRLPAPGQIEELLKERRTIRFFSEDKIGRELLEEIVSFGIYAPTNNYHLQAIVVDDEEVIAVLDRICTDTAAKIYRLIYRPRPVFNLLRKLTSSLKESDKVKFEHVIARGYTLHKPPAIVVVAGEKWVAHSEASAQFCLYNMMLYAQSKGLGCCLWGGGKLLLDRNRVARQRLGMTKGEHILGMVVLGYPAVQFANKVEGKTLPIRWNGEGRRSGGRGIRGSNVTDAEQAGHPIGCQ
jgi:nitroreductase/NAD-dependent dihydropyrimidine dehydrogenase PreA subunit